MGCSVYGYAIVGLKVPWDKVCKGKQKVKAFKHNHPEDWEVDPKTGTKLWYEKDVFIDGWDGEYAGEEALCDYEVVRDYEEPEFVIICLAKCATSDLLGGMGKHDYSHLPTKDQTYNFTAKMTELGLWEDNNFGLFAYGYASC
jgi:hypothetical protein